MTRYAVTAATVGGFLLTVAAFAAASAPAKAMLPEAEQAKQKLEGAELTYDRAELQLAIDAFEKLHTQHPEEALFAYYLARAHFPLINIYDYAGEKDHAEEAGKKGIELLQDATRLDDKTNPDAYRLLGDFYGRLTLFQNVFGRMRFGSRSMTFHRKALEMEPESFLAIIGSATDKLYAPSGFGGDVDGAVKLFRKAIEMSPQSPVGYVWLGKAMIKQKNYDAAREQFDKALAVSPSSGFARGEWAAETGQHPELAARVSSK